MQWFEFREPLHIEIPENDSMYPLLSINNEALLYPTLPLRRGGSSATNTWSSDPVEKNALHNHHNQQPAAASAKNPQLPDISGMRKPLYPVLPNQKLYQTLPNLNKRAAAASSSRRRQPPKPPVRKETLRAKVDDLPLKTKPLYPPVPPPKPSKRAIEENYLLNSQVW